MTHNQSQPIGETPSPQELQAWADEAQACIDSGEVVISDYRKARATIDALRSHAALKARIRRLERSLVECLPCMGWANLSDEYLIIEAKKGNGRAPIILRARASLSHAGPDGEQK